MTMGSLSLLPPLLMEYSAESAHVPRLRSSLLRCLGGKWTVGLVWSASEQLRRPAGAVWKIEEMLMTDRRKDD